MGHLTTPTGRRIVATVETIPGTCAISNVSRLRAGTTNLVEHAGETEVDWNGQRTAEVNGERLFVDEYKQVWMEHQLIFVDED